MHTHNLERLYAEELADVYTAEKRILAALPRMVRAAHSETLQSALHDRLVQTRRHVERLESIVDGAGKARGGKWCAGVEGILREARDQMERGGGPDTVDAAIMGAAQKVELYELATLGTLRTFAEHLGDQRAAHLLQETLDEEEDAHLTLARLAPPGLGPRAFDD